MHEKQLLAVMISLPESQALTAVSPVLYGGEETSVRENISTSAHDLALNDSVITALEYVLIAFKACHCP